MLQIDLQATCENYRKLDAMTQAQTAAAVKGDAYGLGMEKIAPALHDAGCTMFFVATLQEGIKLRQILPQVEIAVLGGLYKGAEGDYVQHKLLPILNSPEEVARAQSLQSPVILHFDTGMNRLGIEGSEVDYESYKPLNLRAVMSHFACADDKEHPMTAQQNESFRRITQHFTDVAKSLANSPGLFRSPDYHYDLTRPGMALYGLNPTPEAQNPMRPVVEASVRILQIREAQKGESVGYGASHHFNESTRLATVAFGYADGVPRSLSNSGALFWKGYRLPMVGRVSMDSLTVDLSAIPESEMPEPHDFLEFIGPHQSPDDIAQQAGTIGYEILAALGDRYERVYV